MAAGGPTVTLTFAGDAGPLKRTITEVGSSSGFAMKALGGLGAAGGGAGLAVAGAMVGAVGAIGGLGIAAAAQSDQVKSAFTGLKDHVVAQVQELAKPFEPVLTSIAQGARETFDQIAPALGQMFAQAAPMVEQLADGVRGFVVGLMPGFQAVIGAAGPVVETLSSHLGDLGDGLSGFLQGLATGAPGASAALDGLFTILGGLLPVIGQLVGTLSNALGPVFAALAPIIVQIGQTIGTILTPIIAALGPPVLAVVEALGVALAPVLTMIGEQFVAMAPILTQIAGQIGGLLVQAIQLLAPILPPLIDAFFQIVQALLPIIPPLLEVAGNLLPVLAGVLSGVVVPIIQNVVVPLIQLFAERLKMVAEVAAAVTGVIKSVWESVGPTVSAVVTWITQRIGDVINFFRDLPGKVLGAIGDFGSLLWSAGKDLLTGLWNGISGAAGWLMGKIGSFFGSLLPGWVKDMLGIHSPSKVFAELGKFIPQGLAAGIEGGLGAVSIASAKMATVAAGAAQSGLDAAMGELGSFLSSGGRVFEDMSFAGMSSNMKQYNDEIARMFYGQTGTDWGKAGDRQALSGWLQRSGGTAPAGGGGATVHFTGNTSDALATVIMGLIRTGKIQIRAGV